MGDPSENARALEVLLSRLKFDTYTADILKRHLATQRELAAADPQPRKLVIAAGEALTAYDRHMEGVKISPEQEALRDRVVLAGCFAAAACGCDKEDGGAVHALLRAFLLALCDPLSEQLDYLKQSPAAGEAARAAAERLKSITDG